MSPNLLSDEQHQFLLEHYKGLGNQELTDLMNAKFGLSLKVTQIRSYKNNRKLNSGLTGRFEKGHTSWNKGKKIENYQVNAGNFSKGQYPPNTQPIGAEVKDGEGYWIVKVSGKRGPGRKNRWKLKHQMIWEEAHGSVPKGCVVIFLDENKDNLSLDNLQLVTKQELMEMNRKKITRGSTEVGRAVHKLAQIKIATNRRRKNG